MDQQFDRTSQDVGNIVMMEHVTRDGSAKLLRQCTLPLTGTKVVDRVISNLGVLDIGADGFRLVELAPDVSTEEFREKTDADVRMDAVAAGS